MSPQVVKTAAVRKGDWITYWQRAQELFTSMQHNMSTQQWNAAVIDAVQCIISASDAFTVARLGKRSTSEMHGDAVLLFEQAAGGADIGNQSTRLGRVLAIKSHVEYGPSLVRPDQAHGVAKDVERFYRWVQFQLEQGS